MNDTVNVKKDQLARLISLLSSVIDKDDKTGGGYTVRTGATITIGDVTSNSENIATQTTLSDIEQTLGEIKDILIDVYDATNHCININQVAK